MSAYGNEHSGIRRLEARWATRQTAQGQLAQPDQPEQPGLSRVRGAPDPSKDAPWMHPSRPRPPPLRDRAHLWPAALPAPAQEPAAEQPAALIQQQRLSAALRTDTADIMDLAASQPGSVDWATHEQLCARQSWTERAASQHGACCMAGCSSEPSSGTSAEVLHSLMPAPTLDARASWPHSAMSCSTVQSLRQSGNGLPASGQPSASSSLHRYMQTSSSQTTGGIRGSHQQSWPAYGSASDCWPSHSCEQHIARLGRGRTVR